MVDQTTVEPAPAGDFRIAPARAGRGRARTRAVRRLGDVLRPAVGLLTSPHSVASYLELVRPARSLTETRARVVGIEHPISRAVTLTLRPDSTWSGHLPGQHVELGVDIEGARHTRPFSLASSPDRPDGLLEITATCTGGPVTTHLREGLRIGTLLTLSPAQGDFVLPEYAPNGLLFICGGSGITPVMSMIRTLHARGREEAVALLHYSRNQAEQLYRMETRELARRHDSLQLMTVHTRESETTSASHFAERDLNEVRDYASREVFVCGPAGLTREVTRYFRVHHPHSRVHSECFASVGPRRSRPRDHTVVEFARSGFRVRDSGDCLLRQAEEAGLSPAHGCRRGVCRRCVHTLISGTVRDLTTGLTVSEPRSDVRLCVSVPDDDVVLDL